MRNKNISKKKEKGKQVKSGRTINRLLSDFSSYGAICVYKISVHSGLGIDFCHPSITGLNILQ